MTDNGGGNFTISNIAIANNVVLTATAGTCEETLTVNAPNCNCPTVNAPISSGDETICQGETIPTLTVTVGVGQTANWYSTATGGTVLVGGSNTTSFTPTAAGTFYAEAH